MRRILLTFVLSIAVLAASAQNKERDIYLYNVKPQIADKFRNLKPQAKHDSLVAHSNKEKMAGSLIFSFANKKDKDAFLNEFFDFGTLSSEADKATDKYVHMSIVDDNGYALVKAPDNAVFFVYNGEIDGYNPENMIIDGGKSGKGLGTDAELTIFCAYEFRVMEEVEKTAKMKIVKDQPSWSNEYYKVFDYWHFIDSIEANSNERIGCYPICYEYETESIFKVMEPKIIEGDQFHKNQIKRMGYDYQKYDPLAKWSMRNHYMVTNHPDSLHFFDKIGKKRKGMHYTINLKIARLGYDNVIEMKEIMVDDGRDLLPLRFIDFQVDNAEINYDRYEKIGQRQEGSDFKETNLFFKVGKAYLESDDYEGLKGLEVAKQFARDILQADNIYNPRFVIEGFASPEGNYQSNAKLAQERASYLMNELKRVASGSTSTYALAEPKVQPWTVVADTLERKGYKDEADKIRGICAATSDMGSQYQRISGLDFYGFVKDQILPLLRIDRITVTCTIKRVLTPEEVLAQYQTNKEPYIKGIGKDAYEYFHLMKKLANNYEELEPLARTAYNKFMDDFKKDSTNRPWTLAAYHLARCLIHRKAYDTELLKPYLMEGQWMDYPAQWDTKEIKPWNYSGGKYRAMAPVNDRAIALLQIEMLCGVGSYLEAKSVYINVRGLKERHRKLGMFLDVFENGKLLVTDKTIRDNIAGTSEWNKLVVYAACCGVKTVPERTRYVEEALKMIHDPKKAKIFKKDDPRVHYLEARLLFDQLSDKDATMRRLPGCNTDASFTKYFNEEGAAAISQPGSLGSAIIKATMLDEDFMTKELRWDKYVPMGFYIAAQSYWDKHKSDWNTINIGDPDFADFAKQKIAKDKELEEKSKEDSK